MALGTWTTGFASGGNVTVPAGSDRLAIVTFTLLYGTQPTSIACTLGGVTMTALTPIASASKGIYAWYLLDADLPATGSRAVVTTITGGSGTASGYRAFSCATDRRQTAPTMVGTASSATLSVTAGPTTVAVGDYGYMVAVGDDVGGAWSWSSAIGATYTERWDVAGSRAGGSDTEYASGGSETATATNTVNTGTMAGALIILQAPVSGPTITVQPANDVGIISNGQSTVYTATATGTDVLAPTWSVDGTPIADGGIYDIATTGAGTASCTSTLTITRTDKTGTPFDIAANFEDDNGDTDTDTVTDTWWTGPSVTTFPATDGDGESTATLTSDYVTGVGEAIEVRIPLSDGDVAVTVTTT